MRHTASMAITDNAQKKKSAMEEFAMAVPIDGTRITARMAITKGLLVYFDSGFIVIGFWLLMFIEQS